MKRTLVRGSLFVAAAALATSGLSIAPAGAAAPVQTCKSVKGSATITPGLGTTPKATTIKAKANATLCAPKAKTGGSGVLTATLKIPDGSCTGLVQGGTVIKNIKGKVVWKNHKTTGLSLTAKTGTGGKATLATITGKATSGPFAKKAVTTKLRITPKAGQNCTPGHEVKNITLKQEAPLVFK
jgi:hypothetical protein